MRTILSVGDYDLLLAPEADISKVVELMKGAVPVHKGYGRWEKWEEKSTQAEIEVKVISDDAVGLLDRIADCNMERQTKEG